MSPLVLYVSHVDHHQIVRKINLKLSLLQSPVLIDAFYDQLQGSGPNAQVGNYCPLSYHSTIKEQNPNIAVWLQHDSIHCGHLSSWLPVRNWEVNVTHFCFTTASPQTNENKEASTGSKLMQNEYPIMDRDSC